MSRASHSRNITNRPGLSALSYRIGDYGAFRNALLAKLSEYLPSLKTRDPDDPAIALLDSWAVVADVLTFYQERIANEGYLNTAIERQSIIELGRLIGYELKPGVSASTHLAFTLEEKPGEPLQVILPQGTQAMSIPAEGEKPQTFETSKDLLASPRWNALTPRLSKPQEVKRSTRSLYVQGTSLKVEAGDWLLLTGTQDQAEATFLLKLANVEPNQDLGATLITWDYDLEKLAPKDFLRNPQLFAFRLRAGLFGNNAPRWEAIPDDLKQKSPGVKLKGGVVKALKATDSSVKEIKWEADSEGLPSQDILCLAARKSYFFAGTEDKGIFRLEQPVTGQSITEPAQLAWQPINNGLTALNVQTIYVMDEERGYLLAGTPLGGVFRSKDNGETWSPIGTGNTRLQKDGDEVVNAVNTGIPNVVVRSLLEYSVGETSYIFAGTDDDIYRTINQGQDWSSAKIPEHFNGMGNVEMLKGLPNKIIHSLLKLPEKPENITGSISAVSSTKEITIGGLNKTLKKGDAITIEGQTRRIAEIGTVKVKLNEAFGSPVSPEANFTANNISGIINDINDRQLRITQIGHLPRVDDQITAAGQTQKIINVHDDIVVTATLELQTAFQPGISPGTDFISSTISGQINSTSGNIIEITQANGILQPNDEITAQGQPRVIARVVQYAVTATVELENTFQPNVGENTEFTTSNSSRGRIKAVSGEEITVKDLVGRLQVGNAFAANQQTKEITEIEDFSITLDDVLDLDSIPGVDKENELIGKTVKGTSIRIFAGTDQGFYHSDDHGNKWDPGLIQGNSIKVSDLEVYTLALYEFGNQESGYQHYVLAGTSQGVWRCVADEETLRWEQLFNADDGTESDGGEDTNTPDSAIEDENDLSNQAVRALGILKVSEGQLYALAGTSKGIFRNIVESHNTWDWQKTDAANPVAKGITSIAIRSENTGLVLAGAKFTGFTEEKSVAVGNDNHSLPVQTEWPNFYIQNNQIDLDAQYPNPKILKDSWIVLVNQSQEAQLKNQDLPPHLPIGVEQVSIEQRKAFTLDSKITRIIPDRIDRTLHKPEAFNPRSTLVLAQSELLPLADVSLKVEVQQSKVFQDPLWDNKIFLSQYAHGLEPSKTIIVSGQHIRAKVNVGGIFRSRDWQVLTPDLTTENIHSLALREGDGALFAASETKVWMSRDNGQQWEVLSRQGLADIRGEMPSINSITIYSRTFQEDLTSQGNKLQGVSKQEGRQPFLNLKLGDTVTFAGQNRVVLQKVLLTNSRVNLLLNSSFGKDFLPSGQANNKNDNYHKFFAGTEKGIFRYSDKSSNSEWENLTAKIPDLRGVQVLLVSQKSASVVAGTRQQGVFISRDDGSEDWEYSWSNTCWENISLPEEGLNILALAADPDTGSLFAGTKEHGVFTLPYKESGAGAEKHYVDKWQPINQDLPDLHILSLLVVKPNGSDNNVLFAGTETGGIFCRSANNTQLADESWMPVPQSSDGIRKTNLAGQKILTLYLECHGGTHQYLIAGTDEGVYRLDLMPDSQQVWESVSVGLDGLPIQSLLNSAEQVTTTQKRLLAATPTGIFQSLHPEKFDSQHPEKFDTELYWEHSNRGLIYSNVIALIGYQLQGQLCLFAGTRSGIFRSLNQGHTWELMIQGLSNTEVQALLSIQKTDGASGRQEYVRILAGTKEGLFESLDEGRTWQRVKLGIARPNVQALAVHPSNQSYLFAGTLNTGLFRSSDQGKTWVGLGLTKQDIRVLSFIEQGTDYLLMIGTAGNGIWVSDNNGDTWENWNRTRSGSGKISSNGVTVTGEDTQLKVELKPGDKIECEGQVRTVVSIASDSEELIVDAAFSPAIQSQFFIIHTGLENLYITSFAVFNSFLFVGTAGSGIFRTPLPIGESASEQNQRWESVNDGIKNLEIRCLTSSPQENYLYAGTASGGVFRLPQHSDPPTWTAISAGLTNTDIRAMLMHDDDLYLGGIGTLSSLDGLDFVELQPDDLLRVVAAPKQIELTDGQVIIVPEEVPKEDAPISSQRAKEWQVLDRNNFKGKLLITQPEDITLYPASEDDPMVSEVAFIQTPPDDEDQPILTLVEPLKQSYDPATVKVYANVVEATHGETVSAEILGSGDGAATNQRFALSKPPLTHVAAAVPSGGESTLKVYVNEVEWTQVPSLYPLDKQDRSYILRMEDDGTTTITFGDGQRGARLPSGQENIVATYRSGIGQDGNVGTRQIALKKTGPPSLQQVINPIPATGGANRESLDSARTSIPATTRTLDRIVSLQDFEDFTQAFAGIGKAQSVALWDGTSELVHITVAAEGGKPVLPESGLYKNLLNGINAARDPIQQVQIASFEPLFFVVEARVMHRPEYQADKVEAVIHQTLLKTFVFEQRSFGQAVNQSEVIAAIQSVPGVLAVDLDFLHRRQDSRTLQTALKANIAFWDRENNQTRPAQLLMLQASGIQISVRPTL